MRRLALLVFAIALAVAPAARAAIVPGATVDGPSSDIVASSVVQSDVAPDGTAAIAYLKNVGATAHVWVSRLVGGAWAAPERVDGAFAGASSNPRIGVANGGKIVVTFANGGLQAVVAPSAGAPFGGATVLHANGDYGQVDLAPGGNGYVAIHAATNDVFADRLEGTTFSDVNGGLALDANPANDAGVSDQEAKVATRADGAGGVMAWGEGGMTSTLIAREIAGTTVGAAQDAQLTALDGAPAAGTDLRMPDVSIDGAGVAWVVFRQFFTYTGNFGRAIARPLPPGGTFGSAQIIDGLGSPPTENVEYPRVDVNAAGQGLSANYLGTTAGVQSAGLAGGTWTRGSPVNLVANGSPAFATPAIAENGNGLVAWNHDPDGAGAEVSRIQARTTLGGLGPVLSISDPSLGALQQFQLASSAGTDFAVVGYVQGGAGAADPRRIAAAVVDLPAAGGGGGGGGGGPTPDTVKPRLSALRLSARRFRIGSKLASAAASSTGTTIRYRLSEAATVTLSFERIATGRKVGRRCVKPRRSNRRRKACKRYVAVKPALTFRNQAAGQRRIRFEGRLSRRKTLKPGPYRLTLRARDAAGNRSTALRTTITLLPRKPKRR